jgi:hypothetical protein
MHPGDKWTFVTRPWPGIGIILAGCLLFTAAFLPNTVDAQDQLTADQIVDAAVGDWNRDGLSDFAILAATDESEVMLGVYIYVRDPDGGLLRSVLALPNKVWGRTRESGISGQEPSVRALANGSIAITEQNQAIGRERWQAIRTLAFRQGKFVVAGFTFDYFDSMQEFEPLQCELNFLSGKGTVNGVAVDFEKSSLTLAEWKDDAGSNPGLSICRKK